MKKEEVRDGVKIRHRDGWVAYVYALPGQQAWRDGHAFDGARYDYEHPITTFRYIRDWPERNKAWVSTGRTEDFEVAT